MRNHEESGKLVFNLEDKIKSASVWREWEGGQHHIHQYYQQGGLRGGSNNVRLSTAYYVGCVRIEPLLTKLILVAILLPNIHSDM